MATKYTLAKWSEDTLSLTAHDLANIRYTLAMSMATWRDKALAEKDAHERAVYTHLAVEERDLLERLQLFTGLDRKGESL